MLFSVLGDPQWKVNEGAEGCYEGMGNPYTGHIGVVPHGQRLTMMSKPGFGLILNGGKFLPVKHAPITIEITMCIPTDAVQLNFGGAAGNGSTNYELQNVKILYDSVVLDSALENSYSQMLMSNKSLTVGYSTWHTTYNSIVPGTQSVALSIVRACTRLKGVYVTFNQPDQAINNFEYPAGYDWRRTGVDPNFLSFTDSPLTCQIQVGAKCFPVQPISSTAEFFEHLRKITGCHNQDFKNLTISRSMYESGSFIIGMSMERVPGANAHSGLNSRSGDLVRISLTGLAPLTDVRYCDAAYITLWSDQILMISEQGASVLD